MTVISTSADANSVELSRSTSLRGRDEWIELNRQAAISSKNSAFSNGLFFFKNALQCFHTKKQKHNIHKVASPLAYFEKDFL